MSPDPATVWREEAANTVTRLAAFATAIRNAAGLADHNADNDEIVAHVQKVVSQRNRYRQVITRLAISLPHREAHDLLQHIDAV